MVERVAPLVPEFVQLDWPTDESDLQKFEITLDQTLSNRDVAALVTEPGIITGWGTTLIAPSGFLKKVREVTKKYGTLMIVDEVGTGFSRTGKLFGIQHENVVPDMIVFAKAISNGASAIGTVVGNAELFKSTFPFINLISTFGWTPIACAAALKTLEIHQRDLVWEQAATKGAHIIERLKQLADNKVINLHGMGMEIGIGVKDSETARKIIDQAFKKGLHIVVGCENNIQIMPPLIISQKVLDEGLDILIDVLSAA
jgi:acetylornithine/succinyldiaminopimelate/putrescine aminotransferase